MLPLAEAVTAAERDSTELACYCPFGFNTLSYSRSCKQATLDILWHIHEVIKVAHMENVPSQRRAVRSQLIGIHFDWLRKLPSARPYKSPHQEDFIYECCRITALLQMSMLGGPCLTDIRPLVTQLKEALKKTELVDYWGNMIGLLWWVLTSKYRYIATTLVALIISTVALPLSHNTSDWIFFHIQRLRLIHHVCWPPAIHYKAAIGSIREYFRFREACRLAKE